MNTSQHPNTQYQNGDSQMTSKKPSFMSLLQRKNKQHKQEFHSQIKDNDTPYSLSFNNVSGLDTPNVLETTMKKPEANFLPKKNLSTDFSGDPLKLATSIIDFQNIDLNYDWKQLFKKLFDAMSNLSINQASFFKWDGYDVLIDCTKLPLSLREEFVLLAQLPDVFMTVLKLVYQIKYPQLFTKNATNFRTDGQLENKTLKQPSMINKISKQPERHIDLEEFHIRFYNWGKIQSDVVISNKQVGEYGCFKGYVLFVSPIGVLVKRMNFKCTQCGNNVEQKFNNFLFVFPKQCENCMSTTFLPLKKSSKVIFFQRVKLQEVSLDGSVKPLILYAELRGKMIDQIQTGDEVIISGVLRSEQINRDEFLGKKTYNQGGLFTFYIEVNSVTKENELDSFYPKNSDSQLTTTRTLPLSSAMLFETPVKYHRESLYHYNYEKNEYFMFQDILQRGCMFEVLVHFMFPEIKDQYVTKAFVALALQQQKNPINICIAGSSGVGKSSLLNFCQKVSHKSYHYSQQKLMPTLVSVSGFEKIVEPGKVAMSHLGNLFLDDVDKMPKNDVISLASAMEDGKVSIKKHTQIKMLPSKFSLIASVQSETLQKSEIQKKSKIGEQFWNRFDFICLLKNAPNKLIRDVTKLFRQKQHTQISQMTQQIPGDQEENFSGLIRSKIIQEDIVARYSTLANINTFKRLQIFLQNKINPTIQREISENMKEFFFEFRKDFQLESEMDVDFFKTIIKLLIARAKIEFKNEVSFQMAGEIVELIKEYMMDNMVQSVGIDKNTQGNPNLSNPKKIKITILNTKGNGETQRTNGFQQERIDRNRKEIEFAD